MGHAGAVMVARAVEEDLGLVLEAAEGAAVDDAVAVALEVEAEAVLVLGVLAATGAGAVLGVGRKVAGLTPFQIKTATRHPIKLSPYRPRFNRKKRIVIWAKWASFLAHAADAGFLSDQNRNGLLVGVMSLQLLAVSAARLMDGLAPQGEVAKTCGFRDAGGFGEMEDGTKNKQISHRELQR